MVTYDENKRAEFSQRLNGALNNAGFPERGRASRIKEKLPFDISINGIKKWLNGESIPSTTRLTDVANIAGVTPRYLLNGDTLQEQQNLGKNQLSNQGPLVLTYAQAANLDSSLANLNADPNAERASVSPRNLKALSANSFGVYVEDNSMRSTDDKEHALLNSWQENDLLIFDQVPMKDIKPGSAVLVLLENTNEAIFRKYRDKGLDSEGSKVFELIPLNEDYSTVTVDSVNPGKIIGLLQITQRESSRF